MSENPKIVILDNRDSFTYNIFQYCLISGANAVVVSCDEYVQSLEVIKEADGIILSPGPGAPSEALAAIDVLHQFTSHKPILGVCLGHQVICEYYGGKVISAKKIMHGKTSVIKTDGSFLFSNLPRHFRVARYHSLGIDKHTVPKDLIVTCEVIHSAQEKHEIMGVRHILHKTFGIQFHPEAILTEHGQEIINNFTHICKAA